MPQVSQQFEMPGTSADLSRMIGAERYLEHTKHGHNKFWRVRVLGLRAGRWWTERRWGKIGSAGQQKVEDHYSLRDAVAHAQGLSYDKLGGGYVVCNAPPWPTQANQVAPTTTAPAPLPPGQLAAAARAHVRRQKAKAREAAREQESEAPSDSPVRRFIIR